jgi:hypothetical protein
LNGWEGFGEFVVIGQALIDAGLLQYDFAQPDEIGVLGVSPRQVSLLRFVPLLKCLPKCVHNLF